MSKRKLETPEQIINSLQSARSGAYIGMSYILKSGSAIEGYSGEEIMKIVLKSEYARIYKQKISDIRSDELYQGSVQHGVDHNLRVSILAAFLGVKSGLSEDDFKIIIDGALYHDIGRVNDEEEPRHGWRATEKLNALNLGYSEADMKILKFIVEAHSIDDKYMERLSEKYRFTTEEQQRAIKLGRILKDADALDLARMRVVDPTRLRTGTAKKMIKAAYELVANINSFNENDRENWLSFDEYKTQSDTITRSDYESLKTRLSNRQADATLLTRGRQRLDKFVGQFERELATEREAHESKGRSDGTITICGKKWTLEQLRELFKDENARGNMGRYIIARRSPILPGITIHTDKNGKVIIDQGAIVQGTDFEKR